MKTWIYPTMIFVIFLYVMMFVAIYAYKMDSKGFYTSVVGDTSKSDQFKSEMSK